MLMLFLCLGVAVEQGHAHESICLRTKIQDLCHRNMTTLCTAFYPDLEDTCHLYNTRPSTKHKLRVVKSYPAVLHDSSPPVILEAPRNITVAPGGEFTLTCRIESTLPVFTELDKIDVVGSADTEGWENTVPLEKSVLEVRNEQQEVDKDLDEGWYRCVAENPHGKVAADSYVTVKDLCEGVVCEGYTECQADYDFMVANCVCKKCSDGFEDQNLVCGSDCATYINRCYLQEDNCYYGTDIHVHSEGECPLFGLPTFTEVPPQEVTAKLGDVITLSCVLSPSQDTPGPIPVVSWSRYFKGEPSEFAVPIGEGEVLQYPVDQEKDVILLCDTFHCLLEPNQEQYIFGAETVVTIATEEDKEEDKEAKTRYHPGHSCQILGQPTVITFDKVRYNQDFICDYLLSMDCVGYNWFIYGRFTEYTNITGLESITFFMRSTVVTLERGWMLNQGGEKVPLKLGQVLDLGEGVNVSVDGEYIVLVFAEGNEIRYNGLNGVQIVLNEGIHSCGICGNNNPAKGDSLLSRFGEVLTDTAKYINSWRISREGKSCERRTDKPLSEVSTEGPYYRTLCEDVLDVAQLCHETVNKEPYLDLCVDYLESNRYPESEYLPECSVLQHYVLECETQGVANMPRNWRQLAQCYPLEVEQEFIFSQGCPQSTTFLEN